MTNQSQYLQTVQSEVDICNIALDMVKEGPINSLNQDKAAARWFARNYASIRDFTLAEFPWRFAMKRAQLTPLVDEPAFGWEFAYQLPADCLRLQPLRVGGALNGRLIPYEREGNQILTNNSGTLDIRYISRVENVGDYANTPLFIEAFAAKMAANISHWLTGKTTFVELAERRYDEALRQATFMESVEGTHAAQYANAYDDARYTYAEHNVKYGSSAAR